MKKKYKSIEKKLRKGKTTPTQYNAICSWFIPGHAENKPIKSYVADICDQEQLVEYFEGVDVVFHCAAYVNFQYPPNMEELERNNVYGL